MADLYPELQPTDLTQQTYTVLKDRILARQLKPGERISVGDVAHALGVSRTPVTNALKRLSSEGLVAIVPRVGTFVSRLTTRDVEEIFDVRLLIECHAVERLFENGDVHSFLLKIEPVIERMKKAMDQEEYRDYAAFITADRDLHLALVELTGNHRLLDIYRELNIHVAITRAHYLRSVENAREAHQEHMGIIQAFREEEPDEAEKRLMEHINNVRERIVELVEELGGEL